MPPETRLLKHEPETCRVWQPPARLLSHAQDFLRLPFCKGEVFPVVSLVDLAVFVAEKDPFAVLVEREALKGAAPFLACDAHLLEQIVVVILYRKFPVCLRHIEKGVFILLAVGDEAREGGGGGEYARKFPVYQHGPVLRDEDVEREQVVVAQGPWHGSVLVQKYRVCRLEPGVVEVFPAVLAVFQALFKRVRAAGQSPVVPGGFLHVYQGIQRQSQPAPAASAQVGALHELHEQVCLAVDVGGLIKRRHASADLGENGPIDLGLILLGLFQKVYGAAAIELPDPVGLSVLLMRQLRDDRPRSAQQVKMPDYIVRFHVKPSMRLKK